MFKKWFGFGKQEETSETDLQTGEAPVETPAEEPAAPSAEPEPVGEASPETAPSEPVALEPEPPAEAAALVPETPETPETPEAMEAPEEPEQTGGFFGRLFSGLDKTRRGIVDRIDTAFNNYGELDEALYEEIEEILISADVGMETTLKLVALLREEMKVRKVKDTQGIHEALAAVMERLLAGEGDHLLDHGTPAVYLVIGVNGAGKTTSIGKMAQVYRAQGKKVLLAAADTFRAAAIDQLKVWADRTHTPFVAHQEGSDPAAVVFDGIQAARARGADILICDTAGRLHNKKNLMNELSKIFKIVEREWPEAHREVLLVLDATTGQNAVQQARLFKEVADISGIILTKLDGTARGGVVLAIRSELGIPVKLIGVGEGIHDLQPFVPHDFVRALMNLED